MTEWLIYCQRSRLEIILNPICSQLTYFFMCLMFYLSFIQIKYQKYQQNVKNDFQKLANQVENYQNFQFILFFQFYGNQLNYSNQGSTPQKQNLQNQALDINLSLLQSIFSIILLAIYLKSLLIPLFPYIVFKNYQNSFMSKTPSWLLSNCSKQELIFFLNILYSYLGLTCFQSFVIILPLSVLMIFHSFSLSLSLSLAFPVFSFAHRPILIFFYLNNYYQHKTFWIINDLFQFR